MTPVRGCGPTCPTPDRPHRDPEPDWIGNMPVEHGESNHPVPGIAAVHDMGDGLVWRERFDNYCLCGHPEYWTCPGWIHGGDIGGWTITREPDGTVGITGDPTADGAS